MVLRVQAKHYWRERSPRTSTLPFSRCELYGRTSKCVKILTRVRKRSWAIGIPRFRRTNRICERMRVTYCEVQACVYPGSSATAPATILTNASYRCSSQVVASAIVDKYIGESARVVREMFGYAKVRLRWIFIFTWHGDRQRSLECVNTTSSFRKMDVNHYYGFIVSRLQILVPLWFFRLIEVSENCKYISLIKGGALK